MTKSNKSLSSSFQRQIAGWVHPALTVMNVTLAILTCGMFRADAADVRTDSNPHGAQEFLQQSLVQSPEDARLLAAAARQLSAGDRDSAFQALLKVFTQSHDAFTPVFPGRPPQSTYRSAIELLRTADRSVRSAWNTAAEPLAAEELKRAVRSGETGALERVSRKFPLTESGMKALATRAVRAATQGHYELAGVIQKELENNYGRTALSFPAANTIRSLRHRLLLEPDHRDGTAGSRMAGSAMMDTPADLHQPWPEPLWDWQEAAWDHPEVVAAVGGLTMAENRSLLAANSWQPMLTPEFLAIRTPLRIIAFERLSGRILWSLPTDTIQPPAPLNQPPQGLTLATRSASGNFLKMDDFGSIAVADDFLYFIDHFREFQDRDSGLQNGRFRFAPGFRNQVRQSAPDASAADGCRLVAVRLKPSPHIAWTAGDAPEFAYRFNQSNGPAGQLGRPAVTKDSSEESSRPAKPDHFDGQHFLGIPLVYDKLLFVLTADDEMVWLNCLTAATGRVLWKQPLLYQNEQEGSQRGFVASLDPGKGASLCGIDGDTLVSALHNGVVVGTRVLDGQLLWATNLRDEHTAGQLSHGISISVPNQLSEGVGFRPLMTAGRIVGAAPLGSQVHCLDTQNGQILWKVPRGVENSGITEGSIDNYGVFGDAEQIIMIGERHVRALSLADGSQRWATSIQRQTGRAVCNGPSCLIPQQDGTLVALNSATGRKQLPIRDVFGSTTMAVAGTLVADDEIVGVASPLGISVLPTAGYHRESQTAETSDRDSGADILSAARADFLKGRLSESLDQLKPLWFGETDQDIRSAAAHLMSNLLLRMMAVAELDSDLSRQWQVPDDAIALLNQLPLTPEQQIRRVLLSPAEILESDVPASQTMPMVELLPDWQVRADVAAWARLSEPRATSIAAFDDAGRTLFSRIEHAILFPAHVGDIQQQLAFARMLIDASHHTAAELFLLAVLATGKDDGGDLIADEIRQLRGIRPPTVIDSTPEDPSKCEFLIDEKLALTSDSRIAEILAAAKMNVETPAWYLERLILVNRSLFQVNLETGAVSTPRKLPSSVDTVPLADGFQTPGLIPVFDSSHVGVVSLVSSGGPQIAWWKQIPRDPSDLSPLEIGPAGPGFLIVSSATQLMCLHPFTGSVLWRRQLHSSPARPNLFQRTVRLAGDGQVIAVLGRNLQTCEVYRTLDGQHEATLSIAIPRGQTPLIAGRHLLSQQNQSLVLTDLRSGKNLLQSGPGVRILPGGQARMISNDRVVLLTEEFDLVVLDMRTGEVEMRCAVGEKFDRRRLSGLNAFERGDDLFVLIKDWGNPHSQLTATSRMGDVRLDSGTLFCIDQTTGALKWEPVRSVPAVMPVIAGDPTDLIVTWSWVNPEYTPSLRLGGFRESQQLSSFDSQRSLIVRVIDGRTGKTLKEQEHLSPMEPVRCVHDSGSQTIRLETASSEITISYGR